MRKTSIICSLGPLTRTPDMVEALIGAGMDAARLNMAHDVSRGEDGGWDFGAHAGAIETVRRVSGRLGRPVGIIQDISGLKMRIGPLRGGKMEIGRGDRVVITKKAVEGERGEDGVFRFTLNFRRVIDRLATGQLLLVDDGRFSLEVVSVSPSGAECRALGDHLLWQGKGINIPDFPADLPVLTDRDRAALLFGLEKGVDLFGISFVRHARDLVTVRRFLARHGGGRKPLIAKIEKKEAIDNLGEILEAADGVMVARGDLGVEMDLASLPGLQEQIIGEARRRGKPVIVATQMLYSMVGADRPTRAEVSDIGSAVRQDCDALMLSDETAGLEAKYPVQATAWMARVIEASERSVQASPGPGPRTDPDRTGDLLCAAVARLTRESARVRGIFCRTNDGGIARTLAAFRPACPVFVFGDRETFLRPLSVVKGVVVLGRREEFDRRRAFIRKHFRLDLSRDTFIVVDSCLENENALAFRVDEKGLLPLD